MWSFLHAVRRADIAHARTRIPRVLIKLPSLNIPSAVCIPQQLQQVRPNPVQRVFAGGSLGRLSHRQECRSIYMQCKQANEDFQL